jgi:hypothetical protein
MLDLLRGGEEEHNSRQWQDDATARFPGIPLKARSPPHTALKTEAPGLANSIRRLNESSNQYFHQHLNISESFSFCHLKKYCLINLLGMQINESVGIVHITHPLLPYKISPILRGSLNGPPIREWLSHYDSDPLHILALPSGWGKCNGGKYLIFQR